MRCFKCYILLAILLSLVMFASLQLSVKADSSTCQDIQSSEEKILAPGVTQTIRRGVFCNVPSYQYIAGNRKTVTANDNGKPFQYYMATVDTSRTDLEIHVGYTKQLSKNGDTTLLSGNFCPLLPAITRIEASHELNDGENYRIVAAINGDYSAKNAGGVYEPCGPVVMQGVTYYNASTDPYFFAILKDGTPIIGGEEEWRSNKDNIEDALGGNVLLLKDGVDMTVDADGQLLSQDLFPGYEAGMQEIGKDSWCPRTCVGITADNKVIMFAVDGRQEPLSRGANLHELAMIMKEEGCIYALNLDGGGSTTYVGKSDSGDRQVLNYPSDGCINDGTDYGTKATTKTLTEMENQTGNTPRTVCSFLYVVSKAEESLYFGYDGDGRFPEEVYCGNNYDSANCWATRTTYGASLSVDAANGNLKLNLNTNDTWGRTFLGLANAGEGENATIAPQTHLHYSPQNAQLLRIRLRLSGVSLFYRDTAELSMVYRAKGKNEWLSEESIKANIDAKYLKNGSADGKYMVLDIDLTDTQFTTYDEINTIMLRFYFMQGGSVEIDSIYIGPKQSDHLLFDFNGVDHYQSVAYAYRNYSTTNAWQKGPATAFFSIDDTNCLTMRTVDNSTDAYGQYVEPSTGNRSAALSYKAAYSDVITIRYCVVNYDETRNRGTTPTLTVFGLDDSASTWIGAEAIVIDTSETDSFVTKSIPIPERWKDGNTITKLRIRTFFGIPQ